MAGYEKFVKELGINFEWEINKDTKKLEYRDLTGPEKLLVLKHINFHFHYQSFMMQISCKPFGVISEIL